uniref:Genome polyprotein n=1 Tax=Pittosporum tobira picorna-like virus TaxID=2739855 RepID=A0A6M9BR48_9VIRU|nr:hypothetical protein [Pittosporum tobira picorna-like virus]
MNNFINNKNSYVIVGGHGAVRRLQVPKAPKARPVFYGPKIPTVYQRYTHKERYAFFLEKKFEGNPFEFEFKFNRFIHKYKSEFYIKIYNNLLIKYIKKNKIRKAPKEHKNIKFLNNRYLALDDNEGDFEIKSPFNFLNDNLVSNVEDGDIPKFDVFKKKVRKPSIKQLLLNLESKIIEDKPELIRDRLLLQKLKDKIYLLYIKRKIKINKDYLMYKFYIKRNDSYIAQPEGLKNYFKKHVQSTVEEVTESVKDHCTEEIQGLMSAVRSAIQSDSGDQGNIIFRLVSQLVHAIINPCIKTVAWSVVSMFLEIGLLVVDKLTHYVKALETALKAWCESSENNRSANLEQIGVRRAKVESESEEQIAMASWASCLWTMITTTIGVTLQKPKNFSQFVNSLQKDIGNNLRTSNSLFTFVKNNFEVIKSMWHYVSGHTSEDFKIVKLMEHEPIVMQQWVKEVMHLTDPEFKRQAIGDSNYIDRVSLAYSFSTTIISNLSAELRTDKNTSLILRLHDKIKNLYDDLLAMGQHPHVRKLPFTLFMHGEKGIGKSTVATTLAARMLKAADIKVKSGMTCVVSPLSKYWDQCDHQPVLMVDDLWAIETGEALERQLAMLFEVCSPVPLTPPMAALEDKKMRYNPEIFLINSNKPFPVFSNVNMEAVYRRRDLLVKAVLVTKEVREKNEHFKVKADCPHCEGKNIRDVDPKFLSDFHHLAFSYAIDVLNPNTPYTQLFTYAQFQDYLDEEFLKNRKKAHLMYMKEMENLHSIREGINTASGTDIIETYEQLLDMQKMMYNTKVRTLQEDFKSLWNNISEETGKLLSSKLNIKTELFNLVKFALPESMYKEDMETSNRSPNFDEMQFTSSEDLKMSMWLESKFISQEMLNDFKRFTLVENSLIPSFEFVDNAFACWRVKQFDLGSIYSRSWYTWYKDVKKNMLKKDSDCLHFRCMPSLFTWNGTEFNGMGKCKLENDVCGAELCLFQSRFLKHLFWANWLENHSEVSYALKNYLNKKVDSSIIPDYFKDESFDYQDMISTFKLIKNRAYSIWENCMAKPVKAVWNFLKEHWKVIMLVGYFMGLVGSAIYGSYYKVKQDQQITEAILNEFTSSWAAPENLQAYGVSNQTPMARPVPTAFGTQQAMMPQYNACIDRINKNSCTVVCYYGVNSDKMIHFRCLILRNREMLFLRHYREQVVNLPNAQFRFKFNVDNEKRTGNPDGIPFDFLGCKTSYYGSVENCMFTSNLGIMVLPVNIPECRNITKFIMPLNKHRYASTTGSLVQPGGNTLNQVTIDYSNKQPHTIAGMNGSTDVYMQTVYTYQYHAPGMCGSVLLSSGSETPIIGIHVAGYEGSGMSYGMSEILHREMFDNMPLPEEYPYTDSCGIALEPLDLATIDLETMLYPQGTVPRNYAAFQSGKTQWVPSKIHGTFEVQTEPSILHQSDKRSGGNNPMKLGCEKHGLPPINFNMKDIEDAGNDLYEDLIAKCVPVRNEVGVLSIEESVCGVKELPELDALDMSSSEGFPLISLRPRNSKGKAWLFDLENTEEGYRLKKMHKALVDQLFITDTMRKQGLKPMTVFTDCLKDETLPSHKVAKPGKTRIFSISPIQYTIHFRQYYADFMMAFRRNKFTLEHAIGVDADSIQWTRLVMELTSKGPAVIAGDYKNFGPALMEQVAMEAFRCIIRWYQHYAKDDFSQYRWILAQEILGALHLCQNLIYSVGCGIPSGSPITDILNSMVNMLYIRVAWKNLTQQPFTEYYLNVKTLTYGDDVSINVSDKYKEIFNTVTLNSFFGKHKIVFTDESKTGEIIPYRKLFDTTFLKRGFKQHPDFQGYYLAPLDKISVEGASNWVNRKHDLNEATMVNIDASSRLAFGHGRDYFNKVRKTLLEAAAKVGLNVKLLTFDEINRQNFRVCIPESDAPIHGEDNLQQQTASNVTIVDSRVQTQETTCQPIRWSSYTSSDETNAYDKVTDRWFLMETTKWTKDQAVGSLLFDKKGISLPGAVYLKEKETCNVGNLMPFRVHQYWSGDMDVRLVVNSNKFQIGQLQVAWMYEADNNTKQADRVNIYGISQMHHVLVSASASNEAIMNIKYKFHTPMLPLWATDRNQTQGGLGRLYVNILNPLTVGANGPSYCFISLYIKFSNCTFSGLIHNGLVASPEMDTFTMMGAMKLLDIVEKDFNRDNPPQVLPPMYVTPTASHSWSVGTGASEPIHPLRLDARGQVHHNALCPTDDNLKVLEATRHFALIDSIVWTKGYTSGMQLWDLPASPMLERPDLRSSNKNNINRAIYQNITPLALVSSCFAYWRGSIDLRFDIIASQFHTGAICVSYVPAFNEIAGQDPKITLNQARGCMHAVFSLQEKDRFIFRIPYVADAPFWPRRHSGNAVSEDASAPGRVFIHIINPLIPMEAVAEKVYINVYMAAGPDFEVAVPVQPSFGLSFNPDVELEPSDRVKALHGYAPYYFGTCTKVFDGGCLVARWGAISDELAQFEAITTPAGSDKEYYFVMENRNSVAKVWCGSNQYDIMHSVITAHEVEGAYYNLCFPARSLDFAKKMAQQLHKEGKMTLANLKTYGFACTEDSRNTYCIENPYWNKYEAPIVTKAEDKEEASGGDGSGKSTPTDFELVARHEGERDMTDFVINNAPLLPTTTGGYKLFGENFMDLKNLLRRYQFYGSIKLQQSSPSLLNKCSFVFPCLPGGLPLVLKSQDLIIEVNNRCRDGHVPLILSMYRYFRGSLRYRIVFSNKIDAMIWIQHRPNARDFKSAIMQCTSVSTAVGVFNHTYSSYIQYTKINNIIEFEVPFYIAGSYGLLQPVPEQMEKELGRYTSLGIISVGIVQPEVPDKISDNIVAIYYSVGDDFSVSEFIGAPPCILLDDIPQS